MLTPGVEPGKIALADFKSTVFTISPSELIFESIFFFISVRTADICVARRGEKRRNQIKGKKPKH